MDRLFGVKILADQYLVKEVYVPPPAERFVEYEEKDRGWLLYFGFARVEVRPDPSVFMVRVGRETFCVGHPETIAVLQQEVKNQQQEVSRVAARPRAV